MRVDRPDVSPSGVLILTDEEKRTLVTEGYSIPTRLPLSKQDERNLKKVRRKIKNKISAQESRRKKKEYLEALERKISIYSQENLDLKRRVDGLESTNRSLLGQLRLLQQLINKSKTSSASGGSNTVCSGTASAFSHHSDSSKSAYRTNGNNNSNVGTNSNSSHSNDAVIVGGGKGGSASTCLMVFALFFAALLVGKPPPTTSQQNSLGSGLIFAPPPQGLLDNLISHGPAGFVPGSLSQIGYTWSRRPVYGPYHNNRIRAPSWLNTNGTLPVRSVPLPSQPDVTVDCMRNTNWPCSTLTINQGYQTRSASKLTLEPAPRSRLLGDPNELDECSAPPRTFWSFLFGSGGMTKSDEPDDADQVCGRSDPSCLWSEKDNSHVATEFELALDSVSLKQSSELVGLHVNKTTTTDTADSSASRSLETVATVPFLISVA
ncbi:Cyclic AMP-responsive element-binding protein 3 protein 1 [Fasciola hepatica]|uniref:Cyclic AMP-responsive element-binding protein 3 protein 1 n=1 Tax=Fasciola hepatica TaxID=6192 RepID=A0A4E0R6T1_FASHE|nr:Cyclic AMP-responsive element-binding protein 3 protein 1 [Fasciola hepatica]